MMTRIDSQTAPNRLSGTRLTAWHVGKGAALVGNDELVGLCRDVIHGVPGAVQKLHNHLSGTRLTAWHIGKGASLVGNDELVGLCRDVIHGVPGAVQKLQPWIDKTAPTPGPNGSTTWYSR